MPSDRFRSEETILPRVVFAHANRLNVVRIGVQLRGLDHFRFGMRCPNPLNCELKTVGLIHLFFSSNKSFLCALRRIESFLLLASSLVMYAEGLHAILYRVPGQL